MSAPCPDCFSGTISESTPTGSTDTIHSLPTYIAQPEDGVKPKGLVVIIADALGWELVNNRVLADIYAKKGGFLVYLPDFTIPLPALFASKPTHICPQATQWTPPACLSWKMSSNQLPGSQPSSMNRFGS